MNKISKENQIELNNAINDLTSTIMEHDHNQIVKILSETYRDIFSRDKFTAPKILLEKGRIILDLISSISEYGRVEMNIILEECLKD